MAKMISTTNWASAVEGGDVGFFLGEGPGGGVVAASDGGDVVVVGGGLSLADLMCAAGRE